MLHSNQHINFKIRWDYLRMGLLFMVALYLFPTPYPRVNVIGFLIGCGCLYAAFYNRPRGTYGNARFLGWYWGLFYDLVGFRGIPLGSFRWLPLPMRYNGGRHLITVAPNGSGKGACVQIPTLLEYNASILMIDPKGENAIVTAKYRRDKMRQKVFVINPFGVLAPDFSAQGFASARFNPLANLDYGKPSFVSDVAAICEALVMSESSDPYFDNAARDLFSCFVMYVCTQPGEAPTLPRCRQLLMQSKEAFKLLLQNMEKSHFQPLAQRVTTFQGESKTNDVIVQSARNHTAFLDNPALLGNMAGSDFDFADLKRDKVTVYVVVPADKMNAFSRWFRLLVTSALETVMNAPKTQQRPVLFMLDEFPVLGKMACIETAVGLARGFGIQLWFFLQDYSQIVAIYGTRASSFFANAGIQQFFTPNDMQTAKYLSDRLGTYTIRAQNKKANDEVYMQPQTRRELANAQELLGMPKNRQIVFSADSGDSFLINKKLYFQSRLKKRAGKNPYI